LSVLQAIDSEPSPVESSDKMRKAMLWAYNLNAGKSAAQMDVINYNLETLFNDYLASQRVNKPESSAEEYYNSCPICQRPFTASALANPCQYCNDYFGKKVERSQRVEREVSDEMIMTYFNNHSTHYMKDNFSFKVPVMIRGDVLEFAKWMRNELKSK
jgi:hypothetical protein